MAKKKPVKQVKEQPLNEELASADPFGDLMRPKLKDYVVAVLQVVGGYFKKHKLKSLLGLLLLAGVVALAIWLWPNNTKPLTNDKLVIRVSQELNISGDGNPAILDVVEEDKVSQPFLSEAKNGDKVLLYYKAKRAVLFRPFENRIIHQGAYTPPDAKVFFRRGTADESKLTAARQKVESLPDLELTSQDASTKTDYAKTLIVSVTDRYDEQARKIAEALGAEQVRLPAGESIPNADLLIIVGNQ